MFALECVRIVVLGVKSNRVKLRFLFQLLHLHPKIEVLSTVYLTIEPHTENGTHTHTHTSPQTCVSRRQTDRGALVVLLTNIFPFFSR